MIHHSSIVTLIDRSSARMCFVNAPADTKSMPSAAMAFSRSEETLPDTSSLARPLAIATACGKSLSANSSSMMMSALASRACASSSKLSTSTSTGTDGASRRAF